MEEFFVAGQGWSGWLRVYEQRPQDFPFVLHYATPKGEEDINLFHSVEDVEQFMDELDGEMSDFPFYVTNGKDIEQEEAIANGF